MKGRNEGDFTHSMTDLMSGVAVMFLLIAAIFMVQAAKQKKKAEASQARVLAMAVPNALDAAELKALRAKDQKGIKELEDLKASLEGNAQLQGRIELEYDASKDPRLLTIVFSRNELRFGSGECVVDAGRQQSLHATLGEIFPQVCAVVAKGVVQSIALEGHTDNSPVGETKCGTERPHSSCYANPFDEACMRQSFENNVRLSAARAQFVFFAARDALRDSTIAACLDRNFLIAGRGPVEPADGSSWDSKENRDNPNNRRVVIRVRVQSAVVAAGPEKATK